MTVAVNRTATVKGIQGSADAYVETALDTGLSSANTVAWLLKRCEIELQGNLHAYSADFAIEFALSSISTTPNMNNYSNPSCLFKEKKSFGLVTSGVFHVEQVLHHEFEDGVLVVSPQLWWQMDSDGSGVAHTGICRISYELVKLSEMDFLRLLAAG